MNNHTRNRKDKSAGENPPSTLTNKDARWLIKVRTHCIRFILKQDKNITREDSEDIYSDELKILTDRGIEDLYSPELRALIELDLYWISDNEKLNLLKYHLKERRIVDFFRHKTAQKRDYRKEKHLPEHKWLNLKQRSKAGDIPHQILLDEFSHHISRMNQSTHFDQKDISILTTSFKGQLPKLRRDHIYEIMTTQNRNLFLPSDGKAVPDPKQAITQAIGKRATITMNKIRKFLSDSEDGFDPSSA